MTKRDTKFKIVMYAMGKCEKQIKCQAHLR